MIGMKIERYHMAKESNQISPKLKDWIYFATLIHSSTYRERNQGKKKEVTVVEKLEPNFIISKKSGDSISILEANPSHFNIANRLLDIP